MSWPLIPIDPSNSLIYDDTELHPLRSRPRQRIALRERYCTLTDTDLDAIRILDPPLSQFVWDLCRVMPLKNVQHPQSAPADRWIWLEDIDDAARRAFLASLQPRPSDRILIGLDGPDITIEAPWLLILDHIWGLWIAARPDATWWIYNHYEEFATTCSLDPADIASIVFAPSLGLRDGALVPKPRYRIDFHNAEPWGSEDLRDPSRRASIDRVALTLSRFTGVPITTIESFDLPPKRSHSPS